MKYDSVVEWLDDLPLPDTDDSVGTYEGKIAEWWSDGLKVIGVDQWFDSDWVKR